MTEVMDGNANKKQLFKLSINHSINQ